jgi:hypothetical protein
MEPTMTADPSTRAAAWLPPDSPSDASIALRAAGVHWDAIRVPLQIANRTLETLGTGSGAVICDPREPCLYWLVPAGTTTGWDTPHTRPLGETQYVVIPSAGHLTRPGPHWLIPPTGSQYLTDPALLRGAIESAIVAALGPRDGSPS